MLHTFFRKATEMSPTYKTFVPLPTWRSRFVYAEDELGFFVTLSIVFSSLFLISYDLQTQKSNLRWELLDLPNVTLLISRSKKKSTCFQVPNFLSTFSFSPRLFLNLVDPNLLACTAFYEQ